MPRALQCLLEHGAQFRFILDKKKGFHQNLFALTTEELALTKEGSALTQSELSPTRQDFATQSLNSTVPPAPAPPPTLAAESARSPMLDRHLPGATNPQAV